MLLLRFPSEVLCTSAKAFVIMLQGHCELDWNFAIESFVMFALSTDQNLFAVYYVVCQKLHVKKYRLMNQFQ